MKSLSRILYTLLLLPLLMSTSCQTLFPNSGQQTIMNKVDDKATVFKAKYGVEYALKGNILAQYPDFNLSLFSIEKHPSSEAAVYTYEISSKDGFDKKYIHIGPDETDKKHFFVEDIHFYYHSNGNGAINIYIPSQLLAKH